MKIAITYRPLADLIPYARNSRTHSDAQVAQIAASIREFGFTNPILVDGEKGIIAGHGRVMAARKIGLAEVPTIELAHLTEAQRRAYVIADNKLAENAGWDADLLKIEVADLDAVGFDLSLLGFDENFLAGLLVPQTAEGLTDPDDVPEPPADPVSVLGDVWLLGAHRIVCGDSTDALVVDKALNGVKPLLMVTDPPYGVEYDASWRDDALGGKQGGRATGKVKNDDRMDWRDAWALFPGDVAYIWHADRFSHLVAQSLEACEFQMRNLIIWGKSQLVMSRGNYHSQHEPCWYAVRAKGKGHWAGDRKQTTLWSIEKPKKSETGHSTQKPVECMKRPIENNSSPGQAVYEPFSGSGTTIVACEMTGRVCCAIELNPAYVDVAIQRWEQFTGKEATLEGDGRTFAKVSAKR
ncbi:COG0863 DNA modification methylase [uncultured Caudovirales phage]|uniref:COG0863 DNA modification methylase n=1 Tax=uncultured Caudovirales phage TaxID=2100421 RepID=A0A6J5KNY9_9CAUD|nr:COG0863 DNA modification methylase [uncultured Caudovirales phage]CAB4123571.1 COG0863 DNA modification methylase [uncultured Caudovirales phage]